MSIRTIPRAAVGVGIRLARLPLDLAVSLMPDNGSQTRSSARLILDRSEARVRDVAGVALRDEELRSGAARRRIAADERGRALRLRAAAQTTAEQADHELDERRERAGERRRQAAKQVAEQRDDAKRTVERRTRQAAKSETQRRAATRKAKAAHDEQIDEQADEARLEQLRREAQSLEEQANALTAESEAQRLQDEASRRKAARKGS